MMYISLKKRRLTLYLLEPYNNELTHNGALYTINGK